MSTLKNILAASAGVAALVGIAAPATAQYYPNGGYYQGYSNGYGRNDVGQVVGQAINGVIAATQYGNYQYGNYGYNQNYYGVDANFAVDRCARSVEARLNGGGYQRYGYGYGGRYGQGGRVTGIINIEGRNNGAVRVHGLASSYSGYGYGQPNMSFTCRVNRNGQVEDLSFDTSYRYGGGRDRYGYGRRW